MEIIEYIRKNGRKPKRDDNGHIIIKGSGVGRQKKGVLFCGINPDNNDSVIIGFSLCSKRDKFDYIKGQYERGFGLNLANERAEEWSDYTGYFVQNSWTEKEIDKYYYKKEGDLLIYVNPDAKSIVEVPPSIIKTLKNFIKRCKRYFQDKEFPVWVEKIEQNDPEEIHQYANYTPEINFYE
jgi:hypothetical protein